MRENLSKQLQMRSNLAIRFLTVLVGAHGLYILAVTLLDQISSHHGQGLTTFVVDVPLLIGICLIYLSSLIRRRKHTAWQVTILAYVFYLGLGFSVLLNSFDDGQLRFMEVVRRLLLPGVVLLFLYLFKNEFVVKSDLRSFRYAARFSIVVLLVALMYGIAGFTLMDKSDFHQEITLSQAAHSTIDQFDLTTDRPIRPHTRRAHIFADSLSVVSTAAVIYVAI